MNQLPKFTIHFQPYKLSQLLPKDNSQAALGDVFSFMWGKLLRQGLHTQPEGGLELSLPATSI